MGYYTWHNLEVSRIPGYTNGPTPEDAIKQLREDSEGAKYALDEDGNGQDSCKWYEHEQDLRNISRKFPHLLFKLSGEGEENGDLWEIYAVNGVLQECRAEIVYPPMDSALLDSGHAFEG